MFHILLQVLDDGRLTDGQGREVDFRNTVIILTSNIGSSIIQEHFAQLRDGGQPEADHRELEQKIQEEMKRFFRPEFLNRLDDMIVFHSLGEKELAVIVDIQLARLEQRLAAQQLKLQLTEAAKVYLGRDGYDPQFGARPLKRAIQERILDPLAMRLLNGDIQSGATVSLDMEADALVWQVEA